MFALLWTPSPVLEREAMAESGTLTEADNLVEMWKYCTPTCPKLAAFAVNYGKEWRD